jgi:peptidyl-prolyl cis-trans isomerase B (cyclophilin B)
VRNISPGRFISYMKKNKSCFIKILFCPGFIFFCCVNALPAQTTGNVNTQSTKSGIAVAANPKLQPDEEVAVFETEYGEIVVELYPKLAPQMVERFKKLIKEGFYNGTTFHRTAPALGFIQGGDPNSKDANPANDGYGSSLYPNLPAENSDVLYTRGIVGAARLSDLNSANCQFFIMLKRQTFFDKKYTVFGRIIEGLNNAYIISIAPTVPETERPEDPVVVKRASLQPRKKFIAVN